MRLRAACLNRIADLIEARLEELAMAESRDQGKPLSVARSVDIPRAVHNFRFFASAAQHNVQQCAKLLLICRKALTQYITYTVHIK